MKSSINTLPAYRNYHFLHRKYVVEQLSVKQIAAQIVSSTSTVQRNLKRFGIPLREPKLPVNKASNARFGTRRVAGKVVEHKAEQRIIKSMITMRKQNMSLDAIANVLNEMKVPTKQQGKKWQGNTVRKILIREGAYKVK